MTLMLLVVSLGRRAIKNKNKCELPTTGSDCRSCQGRCCTPSNRLLHLSMCLWLLQAAPAHRKAATAAWSLARSTCRQQCVSGAWACARHNISAAVHETQLPCSCMLQHKQEGTHQPEHLVLLTVDCRPESTLARTA